MKFNVAHQLRQPIGSQRRYDIDARQAVLEEDEAASDVAGTAVFLRTDKGILVTAALVVTVHQSCSRCLKGIDSTLRLEFQEEYLPTVDIFTGAPLPPPEDADTFLIDHNHVLDLQEAVRQYRLMAQPIQPLCQPNCAGLCPECGHNLNDGPCGCPEAPLDERWAALREMASRLQDRG